jgi:hypothetical protein
MCHELAKEQRCKRCEISPVIKVFDLAIVFVSESAVNVAVVLASGTVVFLAHHKVILRSHCVCTATWLFVAVCSDGWKAPSSGQATGRFALENSNADSAPRSSNLSQQMRQKRAWHKTEAFSGGRPAT